MQPPPFEVRHQLDGWELFWAFLTRLPGHAEELADLRRTVAETVRSRHRIDTLATQSAPAALRRLFKAAGCNPSRYRPSSEALLRRLLKGGELPAIHPLVDLNNCLSATLAVPCCVCADGTVAPPVVLRSGVDGESYDSLRGPFRLAGRPIVADRHGPFDTPITGSQRVKVQSDTERAWLVAYLPREVVTGEETLATLESLLAAAPVATVEHPSISTG